VNAKSQSNQQRDVKPDITSSYASQSQKKRLLAKAQSESLIAGNSGMKQEPGVPPLAEPEYPKANPNPANNKPYHHQPPR